MRLSFYALDDTSGTTHALVASRGHLDLGRWAIGEAEKVTDIEEASNTFDVMRIDDPTVLAAWLTGDGSRLPLYSTWKTAATRVGELSYEYPGEYVWRPVTTPDTSGTPFHDDPEPGPDFGPVGVATCCGCGGEFPAAILCRVGRCPSCVGDWIKR